MNSIRHHLRPILLATSVGGLSVLSTHAIASEGLKLKGDVSLRLDHRSDSDSRYQYRLRQYFSHSLSNSEWSLHGFAATGNGFSSSHNTLSHSSTQKFNLRRLYMRKQNAQGKTELGVIPTYKGRVSSTGLSKHGWITGIRQVYQQSKGQLEWVGGYLGPNAPGILRKVARPNYLEVEYSSFLNQNWSYEIALEHMLSNNFLRGEVRFSPEDKTYYSLELIHRPSVHKSKVIISFETPLAQYLPQSKLFAYYSYVNAGLGNRAQLTEDFVDFGHALSLEIKGKFKEVKGLGWFIKSEFYSKQNRYQAGLQWKY